MPIWPGLRLAGPFYLHSTLLGQRKGPASRRADPALELSAGRENSNALSWERSQEGGQGGQSSGRRRGNMVGDNIKDQLRSCRFKGLLTRQNVATSSFVPASKTLTTMHSSLSMSLGAID